MRAVSNNDFTPDLLAAAEASDAWGDIVDELSSIRPAKQSRTSRVADFIFRRDTSALTPDSLRTASRVHTSRLFQHALARRGEQPSDGRRDEAIAHLIEEVRPGNGKTGDVFTRAKAFAATHRDDIATLLAVDGETFKQVLSAALVSRNEMGATRASKSADAMYAALVAEFGRGNEADRQAHYEAKFESLNTVTKTPAARLGLLNELERELKEETGMSNAGIARMATRLSELRSMLQPGAEMHSKLIEVAMKGVTVDTPAPELDSRLRELDERTLSIDASNDLDPTARARLKAKVADARSVLTALKSLDGQAACEPLKAALKGMKPGDHAAASQGLARAVAAVAPAWHGALLERLGTFITDARTAGLLSDIGAGNAEIIDMVLAGAEWDEQAYALKASVLDPSAEGHERALINVQAQHELRIVAREMDAAMQSPEFKSSRLNPFGKGKGQFDALPDNAFKGLKADAALVGYFVNNVHNPMGQRDIAMANWIRLSLHDATTGQPDIAKRDALFKELRTRGVDTQNLELHAAQGFRSSAEVLDCANQIRAFSRSLQSSTLVAAVDPKVHAAQVGMQLLSELGIQADSLDDPRIDGQTAKLIDNALQRGGDPTNLFRSLRRIAIFQVALASNDPAFTPAGMGAGASYASLIMNRMTGMGMDFQSSIPAMKKTLAHLRKKLPHDDRTLDALCRDADPQSAKNRLGAGLSTMRSAKPAASPDIDAPPPDGMRSPAANRAAQKRRDANEAMLKAALAQLQPSEAITVRFGTAIQGSASMVILPGLSAGADISAAKHNSIRVARTGDAAFAVELLAGAAMREGGSLTTLMDTLNIRVGTVQERDKGHRFLFDRQADLEAFLVAVSTGGDIEASLRRARTVETAARSADRAEFSVTATADLKIATLSARLAADAGETNSVHETGRVRREEFNRSLRAEVVLRAELAGDLGSAQAGAGVDLGVRRTIVRENEMLAGRSTGRNAADNRPTLSMVARVTHGNVQRCLDTLLPDASAEQRQSIGAQIGTLPDGTELFTDYRLTEEARAQANVLLGRANSALRDARTLRSQVSLDSAVALVRQADAITRDAANYTPEGFGWTVRAGSGVEKSRGIFTQFARREGEQSHFIRFDSLPAGGNAIGKSVLLSAMA